MQYDIIFQNNILLPSMSNSSRTLVNDTIVDHSDVVGASHVGVASTIPLFST